MQTTLSPRRDGPTPDLDAGLTLLRTPDPRSSALHQLALDTLRDVDGETLWVDARNTASTYALYDLAPSARLLERVRIARAFTAYQHHSLVRRVVQQASPRTGFVVVPNAASLYRDDDVPEYERDRLLASSLALLSELATTLGIPVLVTDARDDDATTAVVEAATDEIAVEETAFGYRYEGEDFETTVYWDGDGWQTTIPYWVELFGAVGDRPAVGERPVQPSELGV